MERDRNLNAQAEWLPEHDDEPSQWLSPDKESAPWKPERIAARARLQTDVPDDHAKDWNRDREVDAGPSEPWQLAMARKGEELASMFDKAAAFSDGRMNRELFGDARADREIAEHRRQAEDLRRKAVVLQLSASTLRLGRSSRLSRPRQTARAKATGVATFEGKQCPQPERS
jgi:hypothetical protein